MITTLHLPFPVISFKILAFLAVFLLPGLLQAQCPVVASCTPGNPPSGNVAFGMGILNVNVNNGAINNTTGAVTATTGYVDYACTIGATLIATVAHPISIQTNSNVNENVRVWIDYDNNGSFNATTELAFSSSNAKLHTGTFTIPATVVFNTPLRVRVSADNFSSPAPMPCSTPQYSQVEDYRITVVPNTNKPTADFFADKPVTCVPLVNFFDLSLNGPTSWQWNFGDPASGSNNTSTLQNPSHTYSWPGIYAVTLIVCNANGCDDTLKMNYINYHTNVPVVPACTPATASFCCGYGITNVNIGNGLMTSTSVNGSVGYEDFTCTKSLTVMASATYPYSLTTSTNPQDTRFYIDLNNDGSFTGPGEMVLEKLSTINPSGTLTIPAAATFNTPLRLRIISDQTGTNFTSCSNIQSGQAEDYTIFITPNTNPPVANFGTDSTITCSGMVPFQDLSASGATSWQWNFGDPASGAANTSTLQNPTHNYPVSASGAYTVTLIACNANGCDTITKTNYISVTPPCRTYCVSNWHNNTSQWITNVNLGSINNASGADGFAYGNYTNLSANMVVGTPTNPITITINGTANRVISIWVDFNKDGIFQSSEKVIDRLTQLVNGIRTMTGNIAIPGSIIPGQTRMRVIMSNTTLNNPCATGISIGETEDYTVNFVPNTLPVQADFTANLNTICTGTVQFEDRSTNLPTSWQWDFGDGGTSTLQNPVHNYSTATPGTYTVTLVACKAGQCDTTSVTNLVNMTVPCNTYCAVTSRNYPNNWIANVTLGTINNNSLRSSNGYNDFTHISTDLIIGSKKNPISIDNVQASDIHVWIDFNRDRIFQGNEKLPINYWIIHPHLDTISVPATAMPGPTRMRIAVGGGQLSFDPCQLNHFDEIEDYTVILKPDPNLPVFDFKTTVPNYTTSNPIITCNGEAMFQAQSDNTAISWTWDFGDPASGAVNNTSVLPNPVHTFSSPGAYTVTLVGCNGAGCDTLTKVNIITFDTTDIVCNALNMGLYSAGVVSTNCNGLLFDNGGKYGNYSSNTRSVAVIMPPNAGNVSISFSAFDLHPNDKLTIYDGWGYLEPIIGEYTGTNLPNNGAPIVSSFGPLTVVLDVGYNSTRGAGFEAQWSCVPATGPPVADFDYRSTGTSCNPIQFYNKSTNSATSWLWNFDDFIGMVYLNWSSLKDPDHHFSQSKIFNVSMVACNSFGCDTIIKPVYVSNYTNSPLPANCPAITTKPCCGFGIKNVRLNKINNTSGLAHYKDGYQNFGCFIIDTVQAGATYPLTITNDTTGFNENVKVWIDYNNNRNFDPNELVLNSTNKTIHTLPVTIPITATLNQHLRMRVISDEASNTIVDGCYNPVKGQIEDYSIYITNTASTGISAIAPKPNLEVYPNPTTGKVSVKLENAKPETYNLEITNLLGQVLLQKSATLSADEETQLDLLGYSKGIYFIRINNSQYSAVKKVIVE